MPHASTPTIIQALLFRSKAFLLQTKRAFENLSNREIKRFAVSDKFIDAPVVARSQTVLWTNENAREQFLIAGKIQNLRVAAKKLDGLEIGANEIFSFWRHVGRATRRKGFVAGRELREGCLIPNIGGGLCQLSNALYDAALQAGFEIVERHAHSQIVPNSLAEQNRDATVFWNYVDLRFRSTHAFHITAGLTANHLIIELRGIKPVSNAKFQDSNFEVSPVGLKPETWNSKPNSCASCGVESCLRNVKTSNQSFGRTAFLVDEFTPEFDDYLQQTRQTNDLLFVPIDGVRFKKANYAWNKTGFAAIKQSTATTLLRAYKSRKLAAQGAARQRNLLAAAEKLANDYAAKLPFDATQLVISQNLLPFLWQTGALGGRRFDVLMSNLPHTELQRRLDWAVQQHPESCTLGDFRAENRLLEAEAEALQNADRIVAAHREIANLFGEKCVLLDWKLPQPKTIERVRNDKLTIVFPASTVGRKGVYELREALRGFEKAVKLIVLGAELEGIDFWSGFDVEHNQPNWLETADLVVSPALVEHKPRRLLLAAAHQIPVVASAACGLGTVKGVTIIESGNAAMLQTIIEKAVLVHYRTV